MGKHNTRTGTGSNRSRNAQFGKKEAADRSGSKGWRRPRTRLDKRRTSWDALSLDKKQKTTRPGSMKTRTN